MANIDELRLELDRHRSELELFRAQTDRHRAILDEQRLALDRERTELDRYRATHEANKPLVDGVMRFANLTVRSLLLLNGGAALAVLTFATNNPKNGSALSSHPEALASVVSWFALGAGLSVATAAASYIAQVLFTELDDKHAHWWGSGPRAVAVAFGFVSLVCFGMGMKTASTAISKPVAAAPAVKVAPEVKTDTALPAPPPKENPQ